MIRRVLVRLLRQQPGIHPVQPVLLISLLQCDCNLIMECDIRFDSPDYCYRRNDQDDQSMGILQLPNPKHSKQDNQIAETVTDIILFHGQC
ncbi:hypothetical protein D3C85_1032350 [compost metagenome]